MTITTSTVRSTALKVAGLVLRTQNSVEQCAQHRFLRSRRGRVAQVLAEERRNLVHGFLGFRYFVIPLEGVPHAFPHM